MLSKTQFPDVQILHYAFFGPFIGALARSMGGAISDRLGGTRVTLVNFVVMAVFCALLFLTLPTNGQGGNFIAFFAVFMVLFLTAGLGSASTFQMISVIFRKLTMDRVKAQGRQRSAGDARGGDRYRGGAGLYLRHWRYRRLYSESVRYLAGSDRLAGRGDESVPRILYCLRGDHLAVYGRKRQ